MPNDFEVLPLPWRGVCRLQARAGQVLYVLSGRLWVTQPGDAADHFVRAGDELVLSGGRTVIEGDDPRRPTRYALLERSVGSAPLAAASGARRGNLTDTRSPRCEPLPGCASSS